jgi:D-2-hydroxyacid dehydrogenase (NADP+)
MGNLPKLCPVLYEVVMTKSLKTGVLHPLHPPGLPAELALIEGVKIETAVDADAVVSALNAGATILLTFAWEDRFLTGGLRWVQAISAGMEQFPAAELTARGVRLTSAGNAHAPAVAEHAIALLLTVVRRIGPAVRNAPSRSWTPLPAHEIAGRTLGVLGLGAIGEQVATRAAALGMQVIGTKRRPSRYEGVAELVLGPESTLAICEAADALVIALPHTRDTIGLVGPEELAALGEGWLVNVGRGSAIDESALVWALTEGVLRGAGLDVFDTEPLPKESLLWDLPNVVITPHMAWSSDQLPQRLAKVFEANLRSTRERS